MPTIELPHGTINYRATGPERPPAPAVVFVHGVLVDSSLWSATANALAESGVRSYAPDLPLGSHRIALDNRADQSPRGVAGQVGAFISTLGLENVTLVGNDTGGAICQFLLDTDASRIGRVVLTNCDSFDHFPPAPFDRLFKAFRSPRGIRALMAPMRSSAVRHSPIGYGLLATEELDPEQTLAWVEPCLADAGVRADLARFARAVDPGELAEVSGRLGAFNGPAKLVWGTADRFFKLEHARQLAETFADAHVVEIDAGRTFVPHDHPRRLAQEIASFQPAYV